MRPCRRCHEIDKQNINKIVAIAVNLSGVCQVIPMCGNEMMPLIGNCSTGSQKKVNKIILNTDMMCRSYLWYERFWMVKLIFFLFSLR